MEGIKKLNDLCKGPVFLTINEHKGKYQTIEYYLENLRVLDKLEGVEEDIIINMTNSDTVVELQFYPDTPIGFITVYHYDVEEAVNAALEIMDDRSKKTA